MNIQIDVVGGTIKNTRLKLNINDTMTGELTMDRSDFTKFCDLLFKTGYSITGKAATTISEQS
jgi:hypothetical protein